MYLSDFPIKLIESRAEWARQLVGVRDEREPVRPGSMAHLAVLLGECPRGDRGLGESIMTSWMVSGVVIATLIVTTGWTVASERT